MYGVRSDIPKLEVELFLKGIESIYKSRAGPYILKL